MHINLHTVLIISTIFLISGKVAFSQDTTALAIDTTKLDSTVLTPAQILAGDTIKEKKSSGDIDAEVHYSAKDSVVMSIDGKKIFLYKGAEVSYLNIKLDADYIEFDMTTNEVYAVGLPDSSGTISGVPSSRTASKRSMHTSSGTILIRKKGTSKGYAQSRMGDISMPKRPRGTSLAISISKTGNILRATRNIPTIISPSPKLNPSRVIKSYLVRHTLSLKIYPCPSACRLVFFPTSVRVLPVF